MQNGVVMVAFGRKYVDQAYLAAASLVRHNPGLDVDLFTDTAMPPGPFSRIHGLGDVWIRAKVDAMLQSRFDKTLYLDADVQVQADIGDIFTLLDRFDIAAAHDPHRNSTAGRRMYRETIVNAFPQVNAGVVGFRKSDRMTAFLLEWKREIQAHGIGRDQPSLRELLWNSDLRLAILPPEYNLWDIYQVDRMRPERHAAPRILHNGLFMDLSAPAAGADLLAHYVGKARAYKMGLLLAADQALAQRAGRSAQLPARGQSIKARRLFLTARLAATLKRLTGHS